MPPNESPDSRKSEVEEFVNAKRTEGGASYRTGSKNDGLYVRGSRGGESPTLHYDELCKIRADP